MSCMPGLMNCLSGTSTMGKSCSITKLSYSSDGFAIANLNSKIENRHDGIRNHEPQHHLSLVRIHGPLARVRQRPAGPDPAWWGSILRRGRGVGSHRVVALVSGIRSAKPATGLRSEQGVVYARVALTSRRRMSARQNDSENQAQSVWFETAV